MWEFCKRLLNEEDAQDLTEYALIMVLVSLVAIAILGVVGNTVNNVFSTAASNMATTES